MYKFLVSLFMSLSFNFSFADIKPIDSTQYRSNDVIEFFSFGCPSCNAFEPYLKKWRDTNKNVSFKRVPVSFHQAWKPLQRLYYTLESMNVSEDKYQEVFDVLHIQNEKLFTDEHVFKWAATRYDIYKFKAMYNSFTVDSKVKQGESVIRVFNVDSVPSMSVKGSFIVYMDNNGPKELLLNVDLMLKP